MKNTLLICVNTEQKIKNVLKPLIRNGGLTTESIDN